MLDVMNSSAGLFEPVKKEDVYGSDQDGSSEQTNSALSQFASGVGDFFKGVWDFLVNTPGKAQNWLQEKLGLSNITSSLNSANTQGKIAYTEGGIPYDATNIDSQINAKMTELAYKRDDQAYSRLFKQLRENGINPAIALSNSASPMSSDGGYRSNFSLTDKDQVNSALKVGMIIALLMRFLK